MLPKSDLDVGVTEWHLLVSQGVDQGRVVELRSGEPVRIGCGPENQLTLRDPAVSAHHVTMRLESDGVHVSDLHAASRTSVGAVRVSDAVLPAGSSVRIGDTVIEIEARGESASNELSETPPPRPYGDSRRDAILAFEARYLADLVRLAGGNASHAARIAQMDRPHLLRLLRKHQLRSPSAASTMPPYSQVVARDDGATDPAELRPSGFSEMPESELPRSGEYLTGDGRQRAAGDVEIAAPRLPRIDYSGR